MDSGLLFTLGVACGLLGSACFVWLLLMSDPDACAYLSARMDRLGVQRASRQSQGTVNAAVVPQAFFERPQTESAHEPKAGGEPKTSPPAIFLGGGR